MSADGAALLAAAITAAILANAPRRTVQAVAAAVTSVLVRQTAAAEPRTNTGLRVSVQSDHSGEDGDPALLQSSLRASRKAQRLRKKERRRAAKAEALRGSSAPNVVAIATTDGERAGLADLSAQPEGADADVSALPASPALPPLTSPRRSGPERPDPGVDSSGVNDDGAASAPYHSEPSMASGTLRTVASGSLRAEPAVSAGRHRHAPYAAAAATPAAHGNQRMRQPGKGVKP